MFATSWLDPFQLPRVITLIESLYDELNAALDGVGELRLMTLGNQSFSELPMGGDGKEGCSEPKEG